MDEHELLNVVRRRRAAGASPKEIARALGLRPSVVAPVVRRLAYDAQEPGIGEAKLAGCWVSPGWSSELLVERRVGWDDVDLGPGGPAGISLVLVARAGSRDEISVCGYLVDTFCLGVKNVIGPERRRRRDLPSFVRTYFVAFPAPAIPAPIELAQHLVLGAVAYAEGLGFSPHAGFEAARGHLGHLEEACAISFGRNGQPLYVAGPNDDPAAVIDTLKVRRGADGFAVAS